MRDHNSPRGWPLLLVMAGALASMAGATAVFITHEDAWYYLVASGCFLQFLGWTQHGRRRTGGAR
ncbi:hypothetical protein ACIPK5_14800 [Streptomyces sp. NPDC086843]|uniref:hypothetical protein n=1 Tax=Streptomyces sp. NPDC086843 TaxID=3365763 RepID=UPI003824664A